MDNSVDKDFLNDLFGLFDPKAKAETLDSYYEKGRIKEYYELLNSLKAAGRRVKRNSNGKHIIE